MPMPCPPQALCAAVFAMLAVFSFGVLLEAMKPCHREEGAMAWDFITHVRPLAGQLCLCHATHSEAFYGAGGGGSLFLSLPPSFRSLHLSP